MITKEQLIEFIQENNFDIAGILNMLSKYLEDDKCTNLLTELADRIDDIYYGYNKYIQTKSILL